MVGTILPIVYGERTFNSRRTARWIYVLGSMAGGATLGAAAGGIGAALSGDELPSAGASLLLVVGGLHLAYAMRELGFCSLPVPQSRWQVPRRWLATLPRNATLLAYGAALGVGVLTRMPVSTFGIGLVWAVLRGDPWSGAAVFALFGAARSAPLVAMAAATRDTDEMLALSLAVDRWQPAMELVNGLALASSGAWLAVTAVLSLTG